MENTWRWFIDFVITSVFSMDDVAAWIWHFLIVGVVFKAILAATIGKWSVKTLDRLVVLILVKTKREWAIVMHHRNGHPGRFADCHQPPCMAAKTLK